MKTKRTVMGICIYIIGLVIMGYGYLLEFNNPATTNMEFFTSLPTKLIGLSLIPLAIGGFFINKYWFFRDK